MTDKCKGCNNVKGCITCVDGSCWAHYEETISKDLEEASDKCYFRHHYRARESFIEGAHWQKQQMMKDAVDGVVHRFDGDGLAAIHYNDPKGVPMCYYASASGLEAGDKVKLILAKED